MKLPKRDALPSAHMPVQFGRRLFLAAAGLAPTATLWSADQPRPITQASVPDDPAAPKEQIGTVPPSLPFDGEVTFTRNDFALRIQPFSLTEVRLSPGPFHSAQEANRALLRRYEADRLLHTFRINAHLPSSAKPLGGWEKPDVELRGHFTGHYLSACALMYAATDDTELKSKAEYMVAELAKCQEKLGNGYLSAFPISLFDRLKARKRVWAPFYTYHKILAGMLDVHQYCGDQAALRVAQGMADWVDQWTAALSPELMQMVLDEEFGGMNEALYNLAAITSTPRYAAVGDRFTKKRFFNPLALRRDQLRGIHTNTHIPQVIGAGRRYELSSDLRFHDVADAFWTEVVETRTYVSGGTSSNEGWLTEPNHLAQELSRRPETNECCCAYNMMNLARMLYTWSGDPRIFDYYERNLYNHRLGTIDLSNGHTQYFLALAPGSWRTFGTEDNSFWCCNGTGVEEFSKLADSIYFHDDSNVYVNLFIPSELHWKERGIQIKQTGQFPSEPRIAFEIITDSPKQFALKLRIPSWVHGVPSVSIHGKPSEVSADAGSYLVVQRNWRRGDRVQLNLPMGLHVEKMPDDPSLRAFLYGPLVLASRLDEAKLPDAAVVGLQAPDLKKQPPPEISPLAPRDADVQHWKRRSADSLEFRPPGENQKLAFLPFNSIGAGERYSIYWKIS
ncbi:MAG: glycoside hydrolase family 127 protein [Bryobacteraceae bacterium]